MSDLGTPSPQTTLGILLGASEWPKASFQASEAFANSAREIRNYLMGSLGVSADNFLDLFDTADSPDALDLRIEDFLTKRVSSLKENEDSAKDLIIYFIGHGGFTRPDDEFYLAIRSSRETNSRASSLQVKSLAHTIKENARRLRRIVILDCCFAASAYHAFQAEGPEEVATRQLIDVFGAAGQATKPSALPGPGTTLLCSSPHTKASYLAPDGQYTMFSEALIHVFRTGSFRMGGSLTLRTVANLAWGYLKERYPEGAPRPEIHSPDQREGDVADVPFFPNPTLTEAAQPRDVFQWFVPTESAIQCYVVISETEERSSGLAQIVSTTLKHYKSEIEKITKSRLLDNPYVINASEVMQSPERYGNAILASCCAEIAVFDVTSYEPAVMLMLGVRSVVRRGVTLCSAGGEYVTGSPIEYPFNLREVNILSHSEKQFERKYNPIELIGEKLRAGLEQLFKFPDYLDLPAFEAIRRLPLDLASRTPKDYTEQVLVLCPFKQEYQRNNWTRYLQISLPAYIRYISGTDKTPEIIRTLDMKSPRLVSQSLYEAIRLTSMCIVDWTGWQANVFFELGVRLAVSEIGAVCILEHQDTASRSAENESLEEVRLKNTVRQRAHLLDRFAPILYRAPSPHDRATLDMDDFRKMVDYHKTLVSSRSGDIPILGDLPPDFTYTAITQSIDWRVEVSAKPVYKELIESADLLSERESKGKSPVLYPGNALLVEKAAEGAIERRLAAWYYLDQRYGLDEIKSDSELAKTYETLGNILASTLLGSPRTVDKELAQAIREKVKPLRKPRRREDG
ncbi:MAG TPA: hypothetical protein VIA62_17745 [Thermoanaerobaculia bacterium]|nr:hypothetical protein [Thermoanaerobaculia bacterium]